jgi:biotin synthase-related radical SAM superfamily protein
MSDDALSILDMMEPVLEELRGVVAVIVGDGFTDEQARELVIAMYVRALRGTPEETQ